MTDTLKTYTVTLDYLHEYDGGGQRRVTLPVHATSGLMALATSKSLIETIVECNIWLIGWSVEEVRDGLPG